MLRGYGGLSTILSKPGQVLDTTAPRPFVVFVCNGRFSSCSFCSRLWVNDVEVYAAHCRMTNVIHNVIVTTNIWPTAIPGQIVYYQQQHCLFVFFTSLTAQSRSVLPAWYCHSRDKSNSSVTLLPSRPIIQTQNMNRHASFSLTKTPNKLLTSLGSNHRLFLVRFPIPTNQ